MSRLTKVLLLTILAAIFTLSAGNTYSQTDDEIVSKFVKEQLEVKENQTIFNVFKIENRTDRSYNIQVNFTIPSDWNFFGERTEYIAMKPHDVVSIPIRIAPSIKAKGGIGYALNAAVLTADGTMFASKYCFLTLPVRYDIKPNFSAIAYYLDHQHGRTEVSLKVKNESNANVLTGIKLFSDESLDFIDAGTNRFETEVSLPPEMDTTVRLKVKYADYIEDLDYYNRSLTAEITYNDTILKRYSFIKYLNYKYENYIPEEDRPLLIEVSMLDLLSDQINWRFIVMGKLKFKMNRYLQYYYRSLSAQMKDQPNFDYDEYYVRYHTPKTEITVGNLRDNQELSLFGKGIKWKQQFGSSLFLELGAIDDIYSNNYAFSGKITKRFGIGSVTGSYTQMLNDTSLNSYVKMYGLETDINTNAGRFRLGGFYSRYDAPEYKGTNGYQYDFLYNKSIKRVYTYLSAKTVSPYFVTYNHGRTDRSATVIYSFNRRSSLTLNYNYYKYQPATVYNNLAEGMNYNYHNIRVLYNYKLSAFSTIYFGPNFDYGTCNFYGSEYTDLLKLTSSKIEMGYNYFPNLAYLKSVNINMQAGQTNPLEYDKRLSSEYDEQKPMLKFSGSVLGRNWGVFAMYYSGLYNMTTALSNFYSGTAGKYLYFMPYYRITSPNKIFYYEVRFSYLNNIDLRNVRSSIMQEAGANLGNGWSLKLLNNTNIQSITDNNGQSYKYTNNYMEFTVRKVFNWGQPGQKYHSLQTVFYRDLNGNRRKDPNEPGVENVVLNIQNNVSQDTTYHYEGEMFGNIDIASNQNGLTLYKDIPDAQYYLSFDPKGGNTEQYSIIDNHRTIDLKRDTTIYVPFAERNKVFGHVKFNRSKQTMFEDLKLDNIKITITDSYGNSWFAVTDMNGYYEIFAPIADYYTVQINNIWQDYFDIRQEKYIIKFNGYKTFEVNFEFDEKKRQIKFDDVVDIDDITEMDNFSYEDVTQIKQTILRGTVADEATLEPLKALVEVSDFSRNNVVAKQNSSNTNGSFFLRFITGKNYQLKITCPGYWIYQEMLNNNQLTTFETISRDGLLLKKITIGKPMDMKNLTFDFNKSELTPEAKAELENLVVLLMNNVHVKIKIVGYSEGKENDKLSEQRANIVADFLNFRGVTMNRMQTEGVNGGKNQTPKVEIIVTSNN